MIHLPESRVYGTEQKKQLLPAVGKRRRQGLRGKLGESLAVGFRSSILR